MLVVLVAAIGVVGWLTASTTSRGVERLRHLNEARDKVDAAATAAAIYAARPTQQARADARSAIAALDGVDDGAGATADRRMALDQLKARVDALVAVDETTAAGETRMAALVDATSSQLRDLATELTGQAAEAARTVGEIELQETEIQARIQAAEALSRAAILFQRDANRFAVTREPRDLEALEASRDALAAAIVEVSQAAGEALGEARRDRLQLTARMVAGVLGQWLVLSEDPDAPPARVVAAEVRLLHGAGVIARISDELLALQRDAASEAAARSRPLTASAQEAIARARDLERIAADLARLQRDASLFLSTRDPATAAPLAARAGEIASGVRGLGDAGADAIAAELETFDDLTGAMARGFEARATTEAELAASAQALREAAATSLERERSDIVEAGQRAMMVQLLAGVLGVILGLSMGAAVARSITVQMRSLSGEMKALAAGELGRPLPDYPASTEPGEMSAALVVFQRNAQEVSRLDAEAARERDQAARAREDMMARLESAFGQIVDRAVDGDFEGRVAERFDDRQLNRLAEGLNRLLDTVQVGLRETIQVLGGLSQGDLTRRMKGDFRGAFHELKVNVDQTLEHLSTIVNAIRDAGEGIAMDTNAISQGAEDMSMRATAQAATLEETSATMEEMSATVQTNAATAAHMAEAASRSSARAQQGEKVVSRTAEAMTKIDRNAGEIGAFASLIDSIAFQTNLLALNAAVEAARAGEAGKGFAVVAKEVRDLAHRASVASTDIRDVIEKSGADVREGVNLVGETGVLLKELTAAAVDFAESTRNIDGASREQAGGVQQITDAVAHMDETTQRSSALAEENARAAARLAERARELQTQLDFFKVGGRTESRPARRVA
ncbi:methyl-accepting chemotaxis protein [uncultured Albimonas sp.]|uniref:methyl-accepting chemotaxis protein n=1 Tax=uncultured Albimonas sp. TaxID=1331701 RepID=UPI0030EE7C58